MPDPLSYFGITPPGNPLSQFFPQQGGDSDVASYLEGRPQGGSRIPLEYQIASRLPDLSGFLGQVNKLRGDTQAKKLIGDLGDLDFGSKDYPSSVAKLLSRNPDAAMNPAVQNILKLKEFAGKQANDTRYDTQAATAAKGLLSIPEDDPQYDQKFQNYISGLDPEVLTHPRLASLLERGQHNSAMIRSKRSADQQEQQAVRKQARGFGLKPEDYKDSDSLSDAVADRMQKAGQRKEMMEFFKSEPEFRKQYAGALSSLQAPTSGPDYDSEKMQAVGIDDPKKMTPELWVRGDALAKQARISKVRALNNEMALFGVSPFGTTFETSGGEPVTKPSSAATIVPQGTSVRTPAQSGSTPGNPFSSLSQNLQKSREAESSAKAKNVSSDNAAWEAAKGDILKKYASVIPQNASTPEEVIGPILDAMVEDGDADQEAAFTDSSGRSPTRREVLYAIAKDPRLLSAFGPSPITTPSGNRVTLTPIVKTP